MFYDYILGFFLIKSYSIRLKISQTYFGTEGVIHNTYKYFLHGIGCQTDGRTPDLNLNIWNADLVKLEAP